MRHPGKGAAARTPRYSRRKVKSPLSERLTSPLDLEAHLPYRIATLSNLLVADRDPLVRTMTKLGLRELRVLLNVGSYMPVRAADIAYQTRLGAYTVSRATKALAKQGWIRGAPDPDDSRNQFLELTSRGETLYRRLADLLQTRAERIAEALTRAERSALFDMLSRLEDRAEEVLAEEARACSDAGRALTMDQKELLRWYKRGPRRGAD